MIWTIWDPDFGDFRDWGQDFADFGDVGSDSM